MTNGQEELASLAYLITMGSSTNGEHIGRGPGFTRAPPSWPATRRLRRCGGGRPYDGPRFLSVEDAAAFCAAMNRRCVDISAQTYKPNCPPVALTKLPLIPRRRWSAGCWPCLTRN